MNNIIVKYSKIHGKGVFAARDFKKGEIIINWSEYTKIISKEEFNQLSDDEKRYVSFIEGKYIHFFPPARFVNHSCDPNTKAINMCDTSVRNIKKGEEITADYISENVPNLDIKCNCGSKNCRKFLKTN